MPEPWTADIIGEMHLNRITAKELSAKLGYHPKYVSKALNSHCNPKKPNKRSGRRWTNLSSRSSKRPEFFI